MFISVFFCSSTNKRHLRVYFVFVCTGTTIPKPTPHIHSHPFPGHSIPTQPHPTFPHSSYLCACLRRPTIKHTTRTNVATHNRTNVDTPNATGAPLGESLWKLPNRRFNPEYYVQIKKPISMSQIRKKLKKGDYVNITDLTGDLYLMLDNAKKAFPGTHKVYKDALKMQKLLNQKLVDADQVSGERTGMFCEETILNTH